MRLDRAFKIFSMRKMLTFLEKKIFLILFTQFLLFTACEEGKMSGEKGLDLNHFVIPEDALIDLSKKKIYFGHQSVGSNIIEGLKELAKENPRLSLNIAETNSPSAFTKPVLAHSLIGKNTKPMEKINDFTKFLDSGIGNSADIAFFKFCFIDFNTSTEVKKVFEHYRKNLNALKKKYPRTIFVHVTVPLSTVQTGLKGMIKKIAGKPTGFDDNYIRNIFNELLKAEYEGKEPVFDLAAIESTYANGDRAVYLSDGKSVCALVPEYTYDGEHLNDKGRRIVAYRLIMFLAKLG